MENYLRLIQALFRDQTIPWLSHAMHPRASCGKSMTRQTGPDFIEPRIGSTGVDAQPFGTYLSSPPDSDSRHLLKCHLRRTRQEENGVALRPSFTTDTNFGVGGIARCRKSANQLPWWFQHIGDCVR